jgi:hypothetical protein
MKTEVVTDPIVGKKKSFRRYIRSLDGGEGIHENGKLYHCL